MNRIRSRKRNGGGNINLGGSHPENIQTFFSQRPCLIKAYGCNCTSYIDSVQKVGECLCAAEQACALRDYIGGAMQKIFSLFNLVIANAMPTVVATGRAGGTALVNRSKARIVASPDRCRDIRKLNALVIEVVLS